MTVKAIWLGGPGEPETCEWNGISFKRGEAVELDNVFMIKKAKGNPFFSVDDPEGDKKEAAAANLAKARKVKASKKKPVEKIDA